MLTCLTSNTKKDDVSGNGFKKRKTLIKTNVDIRYGIIPTINLLRLCHFDYNLVFFHCLCSYHGESWETISQQKVHYARQ